MTDSASVATLSIQHLEGTCGVGWAPAVASSKLQKRAGICAWMTAGLSDSTTASDTSVHSIMSVSVPILVGLTAHDYPGRRKIACDKLPAEVTLPCYCRPCGKSQKAMDMMQHQSRLVLAVNDEHPEDMDIMRFTRSRWVCKHRRHGGSAACNNT